MKHIVSVLRPGARFRDAVTGRYVTRLYALLHPATTVCERTR
jgi:hypothetical protein